MASYAKYLLGYAAYKIRLTNRKKSCQIIWFMFVWFMLCDKMTLKMHQALHQLNERDDEMSILVMKCPKNGLSVKATKLLAGLCVQFWVCTPTFAAAKFRLWHILSRPVRC
jgi:hypothetical protein